MPILKVNAYQTTDGRLHDTHAEAARHAARIALESLFPNNLPCLNTVLDNAEAVYDALEPMFAAQPATKERALSIDDPDTHSLAR
jgi:hypothetical protein